ncbi:hypothetical protein [Streptomyces sp. NPDC008150]|uniref:hypothetical protein n=1 Tax=Streptomyces sp. NPDC008150 TaxID=3364816 RepID=UPI0036EA13BB
MGWNSANRIFDPVARALIDTGADTTTTTRKVLSDLIGELQDGDWDTGDESLEDFLDHSAVVSAFADRNVHLGDRSCCRRELDADLRQCLIRMRHDDIDETEMAAAIDAYAQQLAEQARRADCCGADVCACREIAATAVARPA